jgi:hypothetical protein
MQTTRNGHGPTALIPNKRSHNDNAIIGQQQNKCVATIKIWMIFAVKTGKTMMYGENI